MKDTSRARVKANLEHQVKDISNEVDWDLTIHLHFRFKYIGREYSAIAL